jgi:hypothetical protein
MEGGLAGWGYAVFSRRACPTLSMTTIECVIQFAPTLLLDDMYMIRNLVGLLSLLRWLDARDEQMNLGNPPPSTTILSMCVCPHFAIGNVSRYYGLRNNALIR